VHKQVDRRLKINYHQVDNGSITGVIGAPDLRALRLECISGRTRHRIPVRTATGLANVAPDDVKKVHQLLADRMRAVATVLISATPSHPAATELWGEYCRASELARMRQAWTDLAGAPLVFRSFSGSASERQFDAVLCLSSVAPQPAFPEGHQVVLVTLSRTGKPALRWTRTESPAFGSASETIEVLHDRMEGRWLLKLGKEAPLELDPTGSQILDSPMATASGQKWIALFSGDL